MSYFKFICPSCGQKIKTDAAASGRRIDCPGCQSTLIIPASTGDPGEAPLAAKVDSETGASPQKKVSKESSPFEPEAGVPAEKPASTPSAPPVKIPVPARKTEATPAAVKRSEDPKPPDSEPAAVAEAPSAGPRIQIAELTPAIKRQIVLSARRRISDESHWMPRLTEKGDYAYAAKPEDGNLVAVDVESPEATHFSILGAVLLEMVLRNVTRTATGRVEFLDHELLEAIREVAGNEAGDAEGGEREMLERGKQVPPISHAKSLEALDLLSERYLAEVEAGSEGGSERQEYLQLVELNRRLQRKVPVSLEDLCAALTNEVTEIKNRLKELEQHAAKGK